MKRRNWDAKTKIVLEGPYDRNYKHSGLGYRTPIQAEEYYKFGRGTILNVA